MKKFLGTGLIIGFCMCLAMLNFQGCDMGLGTGMLIGAGSSAAVGTYSSYAQKTKTELVAELVDTKARLAQATDINEITALNAKIDNLEGRKESIDLGDSIATKVQEGLARDWKSSDPLTQQDNWKWAIDAALAGLFGLMYRKNKAITKGVAKFSAQAEPSTAEKIYQDIKHYDGKIIP